MELTFAEKTFFQKDFRHGRPSFQQAIVEITFFKDKALSVSDHALSALELLTADVDTAAFQYMKGGFKTKRLHRNCGKAK